MRKTEQLNETVKRMQQLYEYSFYNGTFEADQQQQDPNAQAGGMDPNMGADPNAQGGMDPIAGGDPNAQGGMDPMAGGDPNAQVGMDPNMGADPNAQGGMDPMAGGDPNAQGGVDGAALAPNAGMEGGENGEMPADSGMGDMGADDMGMGGEQPGPDDDVVDITQLTDAQDSLAQTQDELGGQIEDVNSKLTTLMKVVDKFTAALDANDDKLKDLQKEIIKRNPTDEETMNVRVYAGGNPFRQKPEEFWEKFEDINNHYNITANNKAPQYQIRKGDIDNYNEHLVADEFDDIPESLKEYFVR